MDDAISRQAVLKLLSTMPPEDATTKALLIQSVKQMDAAQPEVAKDTNVLTNDCISRQEAIDALRTHERKASKKWFDNQLDIEWNNAIDICCYDIEDLPSVQPDEEKISDTLYNIYRNTSPHTSAEGVAAIKYYIAEIWREIYGEEGPRWMKK